MVLHKFCEKSSNKKKKIDTGVDYRRPLFTGKRRAYPLILDPQQTIVNIKWIAARPGQTEQEQSLIKYRVQCDGIIICVFALVYKG